MQFGSILVLLGLLVGFPHRAAAEDKPASHPVMSGTPVVSVAASITDMSGTDDVIVVAKHLSEELYARLRPIEAHLKKDTRLRSAGALVGLSAAAIGALRGQQTLTFVGTEAIRLGLGRQLGAVHAHTGFTLTPSVGHHAFTMTFSRSF
jgi:phosphohistidine swiveling domain-containing protein